MLRSRTASGREKYCPVRIDSVLFSSDPQLSLTPQESKQFEIGQLSRPPPPPGRAPDDPGRSRGPERQSGKGGRT